MIDAAAVGIVDFSQMEVPTAKGNANPQDVIDFEALMEEGGQEIKLTENQDGLHTNRTELGRSSENEKASIVDKLEQFRTNSKERLDEINTFLADASKDGLSTTELLNLQIKMFQFSYETQVTTKISDKANDGVRTLFRQQG